MRSSRIPFILIFTLGCLPTGCAQLPDAQLAVVCYEDDGTPSSEFDGDGIVLTDVAVSSAEGAWAVEIAPWVYDGPDGARGNIYVAGDARVGDAQRFVVARYQEWDGALEADYGDGGVVLSEFPGADSASALDLAIVSGIRSESRIIAVGKARVGAGNRFALASSYYREGGPDVTFGGDGFVLTDFPESTDEAARAVVAAEIEDETFVLVAAGDARVGGGGPSFALARYTADGNLDAGFAGSGRVVTDFPESSQESASSVAIATTDGERAIVAAGGAFIADTYRIALARYTWDGALDPDFGAGGRLLVEVPGTTTSYAHALVVDEEGRILVAGTAKQDGADRFLLARFLADGTPDPAFATAGFALTDFPGATGEEAYGLALDRQDRILLAGRAFVDGGWRFAVARYTSGGVLDPAFSGDGLVLTDLPTRHELARDIAVDMRPLPDRLVCAVGEAGGE
ncbi:MAG TPA: hypothetical protein VF789_16475 [Thermoanaerobaculia bacterium]